MAALELNVDKVISHFREIVKRKTIYHESNLHYQYYKRTGELIPYKVHGYGTLYDFLKIEGSEFFYFERVAPDLEFIAPKNPNCSRLYSTAAASSTAAAESQANQGLKQVSVVKKSEKNLLYSGTEKAKRVCVSNNIHFGQPQSTGVNNPFQNVRNDIKISFDVDSDQREVDQHCPKNAAIKSSSGAKQQKSDRNAAKGSSSGCGEGAYLLARSDEEQTIDIDSDDDDLPWDKQYWHLKITHAVSTNEIWARFFDEFEDKMRQMTAKLIKNIASNPKQPLRVHGDGIYVAKDKHNFYRIVVLKAETESGQCKCFFVDTGETKWIDCGDIFVCPREFRHIRSMAMRFCLYGLIEFKDNRGCCDIINTELTNRDVWAKIKIESHDIYTEDGKYRPIPVILFNSMDRNKRNNISADIMEKMVSAFKSPHLTTVRTNYVTVTHISKVSGNIYCHVINNKNDLKYVNRCIEALVGNGLRQSYDNFQSEMELHEQLAINSNKLHLIYSEYDKKWCRAKILQLETNVEGFDEKDIGGGHCNVYCFLVDYGNTRAVELTNVYDLTGILALYPPLAVAMTLHGVHMNRTKIDEMKQLLSPGDKVCVDVVETINYCNSNKTKSILLAKITKIDKDAENNQTVACDINRMLQ